MPGNMWDNSNIILSDQRGQNYARAIRDFGSGVKEYFQRRDQQEKEDATVDWLDQNQEAVHQLFPQLAEVKDPVERKKVIKAGIKGAGLENLVQVRGFMENQRRAQEQEGPLKEMAGAQLTGQNLRNQEGAAMMADRASEGRAIAAAGSDQAGLADQIQGGAGFSQLDPNMQPDRSAVYMRSGGRNPAMIQAMMKERPFVPSAVDLPGGGRMLMTSRGSAVPDPAMRLAAKTPPSGEYERITDQLDETGAFDKPEDKLTSKEKALFGRLKALNTRGSGMTPEALAAAIVGDGGKGTPGAAQSGALPQPKSKAERDALPKGSSYIGPDGKVYVKQN